MMALVTVNLIFGDFDVQRVLVFLADVAVEVVVADADVPASVFVRASSVPPAVEVVGDLAEVPGVVRRCPECVEHAETDEIEFL